LHGFSHIPSPAQIREPFHHHSGERALFLVPVLEYHTVEAVNPHHKMGFFTHPTSYRLNAIIAGNGAPSISTTSFSLFARRVNDHESHPALGHLVLLVFEAVMEVVCVALPGYIVARQGMFDADKQKFVANLNVALFTPCLSMFCTTIERALGTDGK
jgi:hypothetical protein